MKTLFLILVFLVLVVLEIPWLKNSNKMEFYVYGGTLLLAFTLCELYILKYHVPGPNKWISALFETFVPVYEK
ncbi:hypothetical protein [Paenibacillus sedimenti]|uniref:Uncharacterized protein n=1 Tax=Paenibacillus sedimenti TaxID=2770274 RepID=A0A926KNT9_9BACL|nr:hypothetical protein [Paenibacillus sedimenti]MBD0380737.1 hypothetical protein [Paenibacillus sedimenti]